MGLTRFSGPMTDTALTADDRAPAPESALAPLRGAGFRSVWLALAGSQTVVWMNTVGAATVIAVLGGSATLLAMVQTANSIPAVLLALLAGAVADIVDRRRLALALQAWMLAALVTLAVLTMADVVTPAAVLALTFALGAGMATSFVVYQALTPDFVSRDELPAAVALNGVAINLARALGPAIAGLLIAAFSAGALFGIEAGCVLLLMAVAYRLRPPERAAGGERLSAAVRAGVRFVRFSRPVRSVLLRTGVYSLCASALWALLPVVAFGPLGLGSRGFGLLLGCIGSGAVSGAAVLPRLRRRVPFDRLIVLASLGVGLGLLAMSYIRNALVLAPLLVLTGACWLTVLSSLNTSAQRVAPGWVRARTLATFQLVLQGGLAAGSLVWGVVAATAGVRTGLVAAAVGLALGATGARRWPLGGAELADLRPARVWSEPSVELQPGPSDGPVLVTVEYLVADADAERFITAMEELGRVRRRDGAYRWNLYEDVENSGRYVETFVVDSWQEHLRQHGRFTVADVELERRARSMHRGDEPPVVRHLLWAPAALRARERNDHESGDA